MVSSKPLTAANAISGGWGKQFSDEGTSPVIQHRQAPTVTNKCLPVDGKWEIQENNRQEGEYKEPHEAVDLLHRELHMCEREWGIYIINYNAKD